MTFSFCHSVEKVILPRRTDNTMAKRKSHITKKDRQHNGQKKKSYYQEGQTTQWPTEKVILPRRTDNTMTNRKSHTTKDRLVIVFSVLLGSMSFSVGHCVVCPSW
jgi:hypothetical protein